MTPVQAYVYLIIKHASKSLSGYRLVNAKYHQILVKTTQHSIDTQCRNVFLHLTLNVLRSAFMRDLLGNLKRYPI